MTPAQKNCSNHSLHIVEQDVFNDTRIQRCVCTECEKKVTVMSRKQGNLWIPITRHKYKK